MKDFKERVLSTSEADIEDIRDTLERINNANVYIYGGKIIKNEMILERIKKNNRNLLNGRILLRNKKTIYYTLLQKNIIYRNIYISKKI